MPSIRQRFHLSPCSDFRSHFCTSQQQIAIGNENQAAEIDTAPDDGDALDHVLIDSRNRHDLQVQKAYTPWIIGYPLRLRNTRPIDVNLVGYNLTLVWDDSRIDRITWRAPESENSHGIPIQADGEPVGFLRLPADSDYSLYVAINRERVTGSTGRSPSWGARGTIMVESGGESRDIQFDNSTDGYQLGNSEWGQWMLQGSGH